MRLDILFRLSFFITLGLAACCLALAEAFFMPQLALVMPLLFAVFALAWLKEGVWVLAETSANYLGIVIALAASAWILFHVPQTEEQILASGVPWPAGLLPQLAPVLLILLAVKLFRPKSMADFWVIQTIGLMMVTLGCVLAYQEMFGLLLLLYFASLLWCLTLFHFYREQRRRGAAVPETLFDPVGAEARGPAEMQLPGHLGGLAPVALWLSLIVLSSMPLFFVLPRTSAQQWVPQKLSGIGPRSKKATSGLEPGIDLYRVGRLDLSQEEAFRVSVRQGEPGRGGAPCPLPAGMYWRGDVLDSYEKGRWQDWRLVVEQYGPFNRKATLPAPPPAAPPPAAAAPATTLLLLRFTLRPARTGQLVLAEPVEVHEEQVKLARIVGLDPQIGDRSGSNVQLFMPRSGCDALMPYVLTPRQLYRYGQLLRVPEQRERVAVSDVSDEYRQFLLQQAVPEDIRDWTRELIKHQASLRDEDRRYEDDRLVLQSHAKVARVLARYLSSSGLFRYSLELRRKDYNADPTADFLLNTKQGHCERYASGLALMLRSLGIPARVIKGFRDAEVSAELADDQAGGREYVVRQAHAHSWVQALVVEDGQWHWLNLEPTPSLEAAGAEQGSALAWLLQNLRDGRQFWTNFILEYNGETQTASASSLAAEAQRGLKDIGVYATWATPPLLLFWLGWYVHGRRRTTAHTVAQRNGAGGPPFYERYLRVLADRFHLEPQLGQTPLEFSRLAADVLCADARYSSWTTLPALYAHALYRQDYAGEALAEDEQQSLAAQLDTLEQADRARQQTQHTAE